MQGLLHLVQRGGDWAGPQPAQAPPRCTKCNSPPINGQCTNIILFDVALSLPLGSKGLSLLLTLIDLKNLFKTHLFHLAFWHPLALLNNSICIFIRIGVGVEDGEKRPGHLLPLTLGRSRLMASQGYRPIWCYMAYFVWYEFKICCNGRFTISRRLFFSQTQFPPKTMRGRHLTQMFPLRLPPPLVG